MNKLNAWMPRVIACVLGLLLVFSYAPYDYTWLPFVSFTGLFLLIQESGRKESVIRVFLFAFSWFSSGLSWVHISIENFGGIPLIFSLLMMAILCGYLAIYPALAIFFTKSLPIPYHTSAIPLLWWLTEYLRSVMLTGFPWLSVGYTQLDGPLSGLIPVVGETGVAALLVAICGALAHGIMSKRLAGTLFCSVALFLCTAYLDTYTWARATENSKSVTIIQGNIPQELRWVPERDEPTMTRYLELSEPYWQSSDIIIWPEAAVPKLEPLAQQYLIELDQKAFETKTGIVTGVLDYDFTTRIAFNNMISLGYKTSNQTSANYFYQDQFRFSKHHLLPIGEFIPFERLIRGLAPIFDLPMSSFTAGDYIQNNLTTNNWNLVPAICFEIAFPRQLRANIDHDSHAIITISNDAWFEDSHGPHQHLQIAQIRAKEFGLPVIRSTNNGVTAFIDPQGGVVETLPQFVEGAIQQTIYEYLGVTPYRQFGEWLTFLFLLLLSLLLHGIRCSRKRE